MTVRRTQSEPDPPPIIVAKHTDTEPELVAPTPIIVSVPPVSVPQTTERALPTPPTIVQRLDSSGQRPSRRNARLIVAVAAAGGALISVAAMVLWPTLRPVRAVPLWPAQPKMSGIHEPPRNPGPPLRDMEEVANYLKAHTFPDAAIEDWQYPRSFQPFEMEYTVVLRMPVNGLVPSEKDRQIPSEGDYTLSDDLQRRRDEASERMWEFERTPRINSYGRANTPNEEMFERAKQHAIDVDVLIKKERDQGYRKLVEDYELLWKPWTPELPPGFVPHMSRTAAAPYWKNAICITLSSRANGEVDSVNPTDPYGAFAFKYFVIWGDKRMVEKAKSALKSL